MIKRVQSQHLSPRGQRFCGLPKFQLAVPNCLVELPLRRVQDNGPLAFCDRLLRVVQVREIQADCPMARCEIRADLQ